MSYSYLLEAINLSLVSKTVESMSLDLLRKCMVSDSQTHKFYFHGEKEKMEKLVSKQRYQTSQQSKKKNLKKIWSILTSSCGFIKHDK